MKHLLVFSFLLVSTLATAQTTCDSVDVLSVQYNPFTDTVIVVEVVNNNLMEIFSYPGFVILDDNDDTLAVEMVNYFGIGGESLHTLNVRPGVHDPSDNFEGRLQLYTGFYETFNCEWDLDQSLCAASPCDSLVIGLQNWGGALVIGDFHWRVDDEGGMLVDSGSFNMVAENQYWFKSLCVEPGNYTYSLTALTDPSGGGPNITASTSSTFSAPVVSAPLDWFNDPGAELEVPFFPFCTATPNSIDDPIQNQVDLRFDVINHQILCSETLKLLEVFSSSGQLVFTDTPNSKNVQMPSLDSGVYIGVACTEKGKGTVKFVLK